MGLYGSALTAGVALGAPRRSPHRHRGTVGRLRGRRFGRRRAVRRGPGPHVQTQARVPRLTLQLSRSKADRASSCGRPAAAASHGLSWGFLDGPLAATSWLWHNRPPNSTWRQSQLKRIRRALCSLIVSVIAAALPSRRTDSRRHPDTRALLNDSSIPTTLASSMSIAAP